MPRPRLVCIPLSHYCERARWALDHAGVDYDEEQHLQIFHRPVVRRLGGRRTTPVLVTDEGVLTDSQDILHWAEERAPDGRRLYPEEPRSRREVQALESELSQSFGVETRRLAYHLLLPHRRLLLAYNAGRAPAWQRRAMDMTFPVASALLRRYLRIDAEAVERGRPRIDRVLDDVAERLDDGRPFLFGERLTAADVTFASLFAPLLMPERYGMPLPALAELSSDVRGEVEGFRAHPAGRFALRLYEEHRRSAC